MVENQVKLGERGGNVDNMTKKASDLEEKTANFLAQAKALNKQAQQKSKGGGFFSMFK